MLEHEFIYADEGEQHAEHNPELLPAKGEQQEPAYRDDLLTGEIVGQDVTDPLSLTDVDAAEALAELKDQRATLRLGRALVAGFSLSLLVSLAAPWLSNTLLSAPNQVLPLSLLQTLADNRVWVLCLPVIFLVICYAGLRSLTTEITAVPERMLDERQKMLKDQAHRSAFKIIKFSSLLIPIGFILPYLPWPASSAASLTITEGWHGFNIPAGPAGFDSRGSFPHVSFPYGVKFFAISFPAPLIATASPLEIALAGGLLVLTLALLFSALPMAVLAWKGKV